MSGYWKFNAFSLVEKNFQDQLELTLKTKLTVAIIRNSWWIYIKNWISSFTADYSQRLISNKAVEQRSIEAKIDRAVKAGNSGAIIIGKAELAFLQNRKYQALVVRAILKRMSCEVTNMVQEIRAEELRHAAERHIANVTLPDGQRPTTNEAICRAFRCYFEKLFPKVSWLSSAEFDTYLADFPRFAVTEATGCECCITKKEIWQALKTIGKDKSSGIDGLPNEVHLWLSHMLVPLLAMIYNNWMKLGFIPRSFTSSIVKLLRKDKHSEGGVKHWFEDFDEDPGRPLAVCPALSDRPETIFCCEGQDYPGQPSFGSHDHRENRR